MKKLILIISISFMSTVLVAQERDSTVLTFDEFYALVLKNHPLARQANLLTEQGAAQVRLARGNFDPKLGFSWQRKDFDDKEYYNKLEATLKVPTWLGLTPEVGVNQNEGQFLNPENFISESTENRQVFGGVSVTLGRGLFIDERRAALQQAKLFEEMAEAEKVKALNKLLLSAAKDYWEWYYAYYNNEMVLSGIALAQDIFNRTKLGFKYGEVAVIDTVQAKTNLLSRKTELLESEIALNRARLILSNYIWSEEGQPREIPEVYIPQQPSVDALDSDGFIFLVNSARENHPELQKIRLKRESLAVDRRLAVENLKPQIDLKYHLLDQPWSFGGEETRFNLDENYRFGLDFSFPLFLRKERAKIRQTDLKVQENSLQEDYTERSIVNEVNARYFQLLNTAQIISQRAQMVDNYERLVAAERLNLTNGESDLFKLNSQLDKLLESRSKLIKENANYKKMLAELYWWAGIENLSLN
ncbi:TolC family protein [Fulvivirga sp. RKSG066]|uniref:TolC family protein n=1 Tax=Fulvivirga aurantia TaxID=2529383 RepID=UPI0012BCB694|nr:TolC family protein [Fulvivirga aurantia]MTI22797.1 TolC family protein [Fulvivirga aurantia]